MMGVFQRRRIWGMVVPLIALFLGACSETELLFNTAKAVRGRDTADAGKAIYKIGNPYQIDGVWYYPAVDYSYDETGIASWYGEQFHGKYTANGDTFDMNAVTAAHRTLPLPSIVEVTNLENGRTLQVKVNDRGPYARGRIIDLSRRSAQLLGIERQGTAKVRVRILAEPSRQLAMQLTGNDNTGLVENNGVRGAPRATVATAEIPGTPPAPKPPQAKAAPATATMIPTVVTPATGAVKVVPVRPTNIYIQAGAFSDYNNANRARSSLSGLGPIAVSQTNAGKQIMFRVRLGPIASVTEADKLLERVSASGYPDARVIVD
jgi:rare lipoprotein A